MGLNIRGLIETGKRENRGGKMGIALFSAGQEWIGTVYKGRENNRIILAKGS